MNYNGGCGGGDGGEITANEHTVKQRGKTLIRETDVREGDMHHSCLFDEK